MISQSEFLIGMMNVCHMEYIWTWKGLQLIFVLVAQGLRWQEVEL